MTAQRGRFFTPLDIDHMAPRGLVLDDFAAVKADAESILDAVDSGFMPPGRRWPPDRVDTFRTWIEAGCPEGAAETPTWRPTTATSATTFGFRYDDICFLTPEKGWAVNSNGQILHTEDGGTTWVKQFQTPIEGTRPIYLRCIRFASPAVGWAGTISGNTRLFGTADGGTTWTKVPLPPESPPKICGLSVVNENVIYASGTNEPRDPCAIVKTVDGGRTWTARSMEDHASSLVDILFFDADHGFVVGGRTDDPSPGHQDLTPVVLETTDGGDSWVNRVNDLEFPVGEWGWKLQFVDDNLGFVALENFDHGAILKTLDGGQSWQRLPINDPQENKNLEGVGFIDAQLGWVGGWGDAMFQSGKTSSTRDGGQTWQDANDVGSFINRFWFFEGRDDIAYASGQSVYKFSTEAAPLPELAALMPTRGFLEPTALQTTDGGIRFDYTLPDGARSVWLHVWDRFGNVVRTVAHELDVAPGSHTVTWARSEISPLLSHIRFDVSETVIPVAPIAVLFPQGRATIRQGRWPRRWAAAIQRPGPRQASQIRSRRNRSRRQRPPVPRLLAIGYSLALVSMTRCAMSINRVFPSCDNRRSMSNARTSSTP